MGCDLGIFSSVYRILTRCDHLDGDAIATIYRTDNEKEKFTPKIYCKTNKNSHRKFQTQQYPVHQQNSFAAV